ncbi:MAG: hypothetical protein P8J87_12785, partial [Verrucomicrobiales bacterium]|nr:hypothetical protein [Verrucomicrobiales bacterium]
ARAAGVGQMVDYLEEPQLEQEAEGGSVVAGKMLEMDDRVGSYLATGAVGERVVPGVANGGDESVEGGLLRASVEPVVVRPRGVRVALRIGGARIKAALTAGEAVDPEEEEGDGLATVVKMHDYREAQLPLMLEGVDATGKVAEVRMLTGGSKVPLQLRAGDEIPGTGLKVVELKRVMKHSKQGKGKLMDMSRMMVEEVASGERNLVVTGVPARSSRTFALMTLGDGELYDVRVGDEFEVGGVVEGRYRVIDVRPTQVVIENVGTGEPMTVERF